MTKNIRQTGQTGLLHRVSALERAVREKAEAAGLEHMIDGDLAIRRFGGRDASCLAKLAFNPLPGVEHEIEALLSTNDVGLHIDTPARRNRVAKLFVERMRGLAERAPETATVRREIAVAATLASEEARKEGLDVELLNVRPASAFTYERTNGWDDEVQGFHVVMLIPREAGGRIVRVVSSISALGAADFTEYFQKGLLPEMRDLMRRFAS